MSEITRRILLSCLALILSSCLCLSLITAVWAGFLILQ